MSYKYITKFDSPNFGYGMVGKHGQNKPKEIVIHYWGKKGQEFENVVNWLCNPKSQVSAHYVVMDGKVACLVNCEDAAWHAGDAYVNQHSIGIECRPECTDGDFKTVAEVIADIWKTYGKLPLRGHKDVVSTSCPGPWYPRLKELYNLAEKFYKGNDSKPTQDKKSITEIAKEVINGKWGNGSERINRLKKAGYDVNTVQNKVNELLGSKPSKPKPNKKSIDQVAKEIINKPKYGGWGTGQARINKLTNYGGASFAIAVQKRINELLG